MFLETARGKGRRGLAVATLPLRSLFSQSPFQSGQRFLGLPQLSGVLGGVGFRALTVRVRPDGHVPSYGLLRTRLFQIRRQRASWAGEERVWMPLLGSGRHTVGLCGSDPHLTPPRPKPAKSHGWSHRQARLKVGR